MSTQTESRSSSRETPQWAVIILVACCFALVVLALLFDGDCSILGMTPSLSRAIVLAVGVVGIASAVVLLVCGGRHRRLTAVLALIICAGILGPLMRDGHNHPGREDVKRHVDTVHLLAMMNYTISFTAYDENALPPLELELMVAWLIKNAHAHKNPWLARYLDTGSMTCRDAWGNDLVLIVEDERLVAIGSCGVNGQWQDGEGDDIIQRLHR